MSPIEKIELELEEFKTNTTKNVVTFYGNAIAVIPMMTTEQRDIFAQKFLAMAQENAHLQPLNLGYALNLVLLMCFFKEDHETILNKSGDLQKIFEEQNDKDGLACYALLMGTSYRLLGNQDMALKYLWQSFEQLKKSGVFPHNLMAAAWNIALIYQEMQQYDESLQYYKISLETAEAHQNIIFTSNASNGIGNLLLEQKKYPEAKQYLEKGLNASLLSKNPFFPCRSYTDLGTYYAENGDNKQAEEYYQKSIDILQGNSFQAIAILSHLKLGEIKYREAKLDEAIITLDIGLVLAEEIKLKPKIYQFHLMLSDIYQQKNDLEKSLIHFKSYHTIRDEVTNEDSTKKIKNLQLIFEAEKTKNENIVIKKQKAEIEQKNIELQETIDELTITRVSRKAKAVTLFVAITLIISEELLVDFTLNNFSVSDYWISWAAKGIIIASLKPIEYGIEHFLMNKLVKKRKLVAEI